MAAAIFLQDAFAASLGVPHVSWIASAAGGGIRAHLEQSQELKIRLQKLPIGCEFD